MASLFQRMNSSRLVEKIWNLMVPSYNWGYTTTSPSPFQINLLYNVRRDQLYAQIYPLQKVIPFKQLPFTAFHGYQYQSLSSFSTLSKSLLSPSGDKPQEANLFEKMDKTAYRLFYVELKEKDKKILSALWMQAMEGPCTEPEPTPTQGKNLTLETEFWNDWKDLGDMSKVN